MKKENFSDTEELKIDKFNKSLRIQTKSTKQDSVWKLNQKIEIFNDNSNLQTTEISKR